MLSVSVAERPRIRRGLPRSEETPTAPLADAVWLVVPALVALAARLAAGPHPIDDAYITFRYARNLADGLGLVYNPGEWVLGTTAPLWALVLAAGYRLGATDLPWFAVSLSALFDACSALMIASFARRMGWARGGAVLVGAAWALNPMSIAFATGGMETSAFVLVALSALVLAGRRSARAPAALLAGTSVVLRPEGALLAFAVIAWTWFTRRHIPHVMHHVKSRAAIEPVETSGAASAHREQSREASAHREQGRPASAHREKSRAAIERLRAAGAETWLVVAAAIAPMLAVGATLFIVYGSPLPHSVVAKQVAYAPVSWFENVAALLLQAGLCGWSTFIASALPATLTMGVAAVGVVALIGLTRVGVPWLDRRGLAWQPFAIFGVLFFSFYVLVGLRGVRLFSWYLVPIVPLYLLASAAGLRSLGGSAWLAALVVLWQLPAIDWRQPLLPTGQTLARERLFYSVGEQLRDALPPSATVAAPEIGALGYASGLRILDTVGLVSPAALVYYPLPADQLVTDNAIPSALILSERPDAVVSLDAYVQRTLLTDPTFLRDYRLEQRLPARVWQSEDLLVFRRVAPE